MKIEWMLVSKLVPWEHNPRKNNGAIEIVAKLIEQHGFTNPILVNQDNVICAGHTRLEAAKKLDMLEVPVYRKNMTEEEFRQINLSDNKSSELAKWDKKLLKQTMEVLAQLNKIPPGFSDSEIDKIFGHNHSETHSTETEGSEDINPDALEKKMTFVFNAKEHRLISSKLKAIKKEHGLPTIAHALMKGLENHKGLSSPRLRKAQ